MKQTYTEYLRCEFTDAEIAEAAKELARANSRKASIEQQKKDVDAQLKSEIVAQETIIGRLAAQINTGSEYRNIECRLELDTPEPGKKRVVRLDTGEEVSVKPMTDSDRQMVLDLESQAGAAEELDRATKEMAQDRPRGPIVTPPPPVLRLDAGEPLVDRLVEIERNTRPEMSSDTAHGMIVDAIDKPTTGPTLAPARTQGGTHQKGTRGKRQRNPAAEAFADGSDGDPAEEQEYSPEEGAE